MGYLWQSDGATFSIVYSLRIGFAVQTVFFEEKPINKRATVTSKRNFQGTPNLASSTITQDTHNALKSFIIPLLHGSRPLSCHADSISVRLSPIIPHDHSHRFPSYSNSSPTMPYMSSLTSSPSESDHLRIRFRHSSPDSYPTPG